MQTLILYATKSGASRECAALLAEQIGSRAVCDLARAPPDPGRLDAIVLGSGVRMGAIYRPAAKFIRNHRVAASKDDRLFSLQRRSQYAAADH